MNRWIDLDFVQTLVADNDFDDAEELIRKYAERGMQNHNRHYDDDDDDDDVDDDLLLCYEETLETLCRVQFRNGRHRLADCGMNDQANQTRLYQRGCDFARFLIDSHNRCAARSFAAPSSSSSGSSIVLPSRSKRFRSRRVSILVKEGRNSRGSPLHYLLMGITDQPSLPLIQTILECCCSRYADAAEYQQEHPALMDVSSAELSDNDDALIAPSHHSPTYRQVLTARNKWGITPLHLVGSLNFPHNVHQALLEHVWDDPEMLLVRDEDGKTLLHNALDKSYRDHLLARQGPFQKFARFFHDGDSESSNGNYATSNASWRSGFMERLHGQLDKMDQTPLEAFLIDYEADNDEEEAVLREFVSSVLTLSFPDAPNLVVAMARMANCCTDRHLQLYPLTTDPGIRQSSGDGVHGSLLPLHIACSCPYDPSWEGPTTDMLGRSDRPTPVWDAVLIGLLQSYPAAASVRCGQRPGRLQLPLHLLLTHRGTINQTFLDLLLAAYPVAVSDHDPVSGFYPFQLAACAPVVTIESIYVLLRADPSLVSVSRTIK